MSRDERLVPKLPRTHDEEMVFAREERDESELRRIIRDLNLKVTHQRMAILGCLHEGRRHMTAQELFEKVNSRHPEIGFATVYRFLRSLSDGHFVTEVRMGCLPARYELTPQKHHDHLTCTKCGRIVEFENRMIENLQQKVAHHFGFTLQHHVLELYGVCPDCQTAASSKSQTK